jgi:hypothetical protein
MDNHRSIFGKITDKAKYIADIAAHAAHYALKAEEPVPKAQRRLSRDSPARAPNKAAAKRSKRAAQ